MSTPLTELSNNIDSNQNNEIIGEIINEMNDGDQLNTNLMDNNMNNDPHLDRQLDSNTNMLSSDNLNNIDNNLMPSINIDTQPELSMKDKVLSSIKDPSGVVLIYFLLSSPIINKLLAQNIPKLFSNTVSSSMNWISLTVKSIIAGVLFYIFKIVL
jgi:hypothetical protein